MTRYAYIAGGATFSGRRMAEEQEGLAERGALALLLGIMLLGLLVRLIHIGAASYWSDELFSVLWVENSYRFIWTEGLWLETTPALYYALLKPWVAVFGGSEFAVRGFSALLSVAAIPAVYAIARQFARPSTALLAAALFALMPMQVHYAQEARAYALLPLLYALACLAAILLVRRAALARPNLAWPLALYGLMAVLLVYAHATSAFTLAGLSACCLCGLLLVRAERRAILGFLGVNALAVLLSVPEILVILDQSGRFDIVWVPRPDAVNLLNALGSLLVDPSTPLTLFRQASLLAGGVAVLFLALLLRSRLGGMAWLLLAAPAALFLVSTILASLIASPFFIPRIAVWVGVPFCILAALALAAPQPALLRGGFLALLLVAWGVGLEGVYVRSIDTKEDWRGLAADLAPRLAPGDLVAIGPETNLRGLAFYLDRGVQQHRWRPAGSKEFQLLFLPAGVPRPQPIATEALAEAVQSGRRVWLVLKQQDWDAFGAAAMQAVPGHAPTVERGRARLALLGWAGD
ncbi:glycosyltransferase family 39 protein [Belnapia sp. T6]|uniref:Glycosyltransferase family 39 protein n=1 Tax=Belnapia mucosa TaxID=2804532 RepID=A0ABS1V2R1_9PROT|nr:glycosyltransferase family 39 protein [Belnapia mucosa]MBL6455406.1 glycosyltransferase family 39 protein [Belnapia mucosa]